MCVCMHVYVVIVMLTYLFRHINNNNYIIMIFE